MIDVFCNPSVSGEGDNTGPFENPRLAAQQPLKPPVHQARIPVQDRSMHCETDIADIVEHMTEDPVHGIRAVNVIEWVFETNIINDAVRQGIQSL